MRYEVEKRSLIKNKDDFLNLKNKLDKDFGLIKNKEMKSYLFREPTFLRIRLIRGENKALITEKTGEYTDVARPEKEYEIDLSELNNFIQTIKNRGYKECSLVHTKRYSYKIDGLNVELNEIEYLGLIVEIEALTEKKGEIPKLKESINDLMKKMNLVELNPEKYQGMMKEMYSKTLKPIQKQNFEI